MVYAWRLFQGPERSFEKLVKLKQQSIEGIQNGNQIEHFKKITATTS